MTIITGGAYAGASALIASVIAAKPRRYGLGLVVKTSFENLFAGFTVRTIIHTRATASSGDDFQRGDGKYWPVTKPGQIALTWLLKGAGLLLYAVILTLSWLSQANVTCEGAREIWLPIISPHSELYPMDSRGNWKGTCGSLLMRYIKAGGRYSDELGTQLTQVARAEMVFLPLLLLAAAGPVLTVLGRWIYCIKATNTPFFQTMCSTKGSTGACYRLDEMHSGVVLRYTAPGTTQIGGAVSKYGHYSVSLTANGMDYDPANTLPNDPNARGVEVRERSEDMAQWLVRREMADASPKQKIPRKKERSLFKMYDEPLSRKSQPAEPWSPYVLMGMREDLMEKIHQGNGYLGAYNALALLERRGWWSSMIKDARTWIPLCHDCQATAGPRKGRENEGLQIIHDPPPFRSWHIDFIERLPVIKRGNQWLIVAINYTTGWSVTRAMPEATTEEIIKFLYEEVIDRSGCPDEIYSDRGVNLTCQILGNYLSILGIKYFFTSTYHSRVNGKVERLSGLSAQAPTTLRGMHKTK